MTVLQQEWIFTHKHTEKMLQKQPSHPTRIFNYLGTKIKQTAAYV